MNWVIRGNYCLSERFYSIRISRRFFVCPVEMLHMCVYTYSSPSIVNCTPHSRKPLHTNLSQTLGQTKLYIGSLDDNPPQELICYNAVCWCALYLLSTHTLHLLSADHTLHFIVSICLVGGGGVESLNVKLQLNFSQPNSKWPLQLINLKQFSYLIS